MKKAIQVLLLSLFMLVGVLKHPIYAQDPCLTIPNLSPGISNSFELLPGTGYYDANCSGYNEEGKEVIYEFTPTITGLHSIDFLTNNSSSGLSLMYKESSGGCINTGWSCISWNFYSTPMLYAYLTAGTSYYFMFDRIEGTSDTLTASFKITIPGTTDPCTEITVIPSCSTVMSDTLGNGLGFIDTQCFGGHEYGEEKIFEFTPAITGLHAFDFLTNNNGDVLLFAYKEASGGCNSTGWTCVDEFYGTPLHYLNLTAGTSYYFLIDKRRDNPVNTSIFSFKITCPGIVDPCTEITNIPSCLSTQNVTLGNGLGFIDSQSFGGHEYGEEKIFSFTPTTTGLHSIDFITNNNGDVILFAYKEASSGCNSTGWTGVDEFYGTPLHYLNLTAGTTYYLLIDKRRDNPTNSSILSFKITCPGVVDPCTEITNISSCLSIQNVTLGNGLGFIDSQSFGGHEYGEEKLFTFTPTTTGMHSIDFLSNNNGDVILFAYKDASSGCNSTGWTGVDEFYGTPLHYVNLTAGTTYYLLIDKRRDNPTNSSILSFQITCPGVVDPCTEITNISSCLLTQNVTLGSGLGFIDSQSFGGHEYGEDKIFSFTPTTTGLHSIDFLSNNNGDVLLFAYKEASGGCTSSGWTGVSEFYGTPMLYVTLTAGTSYYFLLDNRRDNPSNSIIFSFRVTCPGIEDPCTTITPISCSEVQSVTLGIGIGAFSTGCFGGEEYGKERLFSFTPTTTGTHNIQLMSNNNSDLLLFAWKEAGTGCGTEGWTCVQEFYGTPTYPITLTAGTTYHFLFDNRRDNPNGNPAFSFAINCPSSTNPCLDIIEATNDQLYHVVIGPGTGNFDENCDGNHEPGKEQLFSYTPGGTGKLRIMIDESNSQDWLFSKFKLASYGCNNTDWSCLGLSFQGLYTFYLLYLQVDTTYTFMFDRANTNPTGEHIFDVRFIGQDSLSPCDEIKSINCMQVVTDSISPKMGYFDNYAIICNPSFIGAERIYSFTSSIAGDYTFQFLSNNSVDLLNLAYKPASNACNDSSWQCFGTVTGTASRSVTLDSNTTYLFLLDRLVSDNHDYSTYSFQINCPAATIYQLTGGGSYCAGAGGLSVQLDGSQQGVNYQLLRNGSAYSPVVPGTGNGLTWINLPAGSYTVDAIAPLGTVTMNGTATITENPLPVPLLSGSTNLCTGASGILYTTTAGQANYDWNVSVGGAITEGGDGFDHATVTWGSAGNQAVNVTYTDSNGCTPSRPTVLPVTVSDFLTLTAGITVPQTTLCTGTSTTVTCNANFSFESIDWYVNNLFVANSPGTFMFTPANGDHVYGVCHTTSGGCWTAATDTTNELIFTVLPLQTVEVSISSNVTEVCNGSSITFTAVPVNGGSSPTYDWFVDGVLQANHSASFIYAYSGSNALYDVYCIVTSNESCILNTQATSNTIHMSVNENPIAPTSSGDLAVCSTTLPATLTAMAVLGSTVDWYSAPTGGTLLLAGSNTFATSTAGSYFAEARNMTTGCVSVTRTMVTLTITPAIQWFADSDGDGYGDPTNMLLACDQPLGYVGNNLDCNDANPNYNPTTHYFAYTGTPGFQTSIVSPLSGTPSTYFRFEADYFDQNNYLPTGGYPRLELDFEGNGSLFDPNDKTLLMTAVDPTDLTTTDGKRYFVQVNGLFYGTNWKARIKVSNDENCATTFGWFDNPDVLHQPNLYLFANDITFSDMNPTPSSVITVSANIHNESDFDARNFVCRLVNEMDPPIVYPDITIANLPAGHDSVITWSIVTPNINTWCPMRVTLDYTNVIIENNELDNTAIRPFVNGSYVVPGNIVVTAEVVPSTAWSLQYQRLLFTGQAMYANLAVPLADPSVAGATVTAIITETGDTLQGYTESDGKFYIWFVPPVAGGFYHITGEVTDYTLTGPLSTSFTILSQPNLTLNICHPMDITPVNPDPGANLDLIAHVWNNGNATAMGPITVKFDYSNGSSWTEQYNGNIAAGQSIPVVHNAASIPASGTTLTVTVDPYNTISEQNESVADNTESDQMCYEYTIVPHCGVNFWNRDYCLGDSSQLTIGINVTHLYDANPVLVKFEVMEPGSASYTTLGYGTLNNATRNCWCPYVVALPGNQFVFNQAGTYTFRMTVDPGNLYNECNESDNVLTVTLTPTCKPNLAFEWCHGLEVRPVNPAFPGNATLVANITNNGTAPAGPIPVQFTISTGGVFTGTYPGTLAPGQSAEVVVVAPLPAPATATLTAVIDPLNSIVEYNESDNSNTDDMCWDFEPVPHCGINFWTVDWVKDQSAMLTIGVNARHLYDANPLRINFTVTEPDLSVHDLGHATLNNVTRNCLCPWVAVLPSAYTFTQIGTYHFVITTDYDHLYTECDETNNVFEVDVIVKDGADMRVLSQFIDPHPLNPNLNEADTLIVSYENIGNTNVNDLMKMQVLVDEVPIATVSNLPGLATGDHNTVAIPTTWSSNIPGAHVVRAIIDSDDDVDEINEMNNEATRVVVVGDAANLTFSRFTVSNPNPPVGSVLRIEATIVNTGPVAASAMFRLYYTGSANELITIYEVPHYDPSIDSTFYLVDWMVTDEHTVLVARIEDVNTVETNTLDNEARFELGAMAVSYTAVAACEGSANGSISVTATGGESPYLFQWEDGFIGSTRTGAAGSYQVTITDQLGVQSTLTGTIPEVPLPTANAGANRSICIGQATALGAPATAGHSYTWSSVPAGYSSNLANPTVSPSVTTTYTLTETILATGCSKSNTVVVTVHPLPVVTLTGATPICNYSTATYTTEAGMSNYSWTIPDGCTVLSGGISTTDFITVRWTSAGTKVLKVNYSNANGCSAATAKQFNVSVKASPVPSITGPASIKVNTNGTYSTTPWQTGYIWTISPGGIINSGQGTRVVSVKWTTVGPHWIGLNYTNLSGCTAPTPTIKNVTVTAAKSTIMDAVPVPVVEDPTGVSLEPGSMVLYPNPNDGLFTIDVTTFDPGTYDLQVYSSLGAMVYELKGITIEDRYIRKLDLSNLTDGVYNVVLRNKEATLQKRVIIRK